MMIEQLFLQTPVVEVWLTFESRVLSQLERSNPTGGAFTSQVLPANTYDNHFRFRHGVIGFISIETVHNLIRLQLDGRDAGDLLTDGQQNVFYCRSTEEDHPGFALQAQWLQRDYDKKFRWLVLGWQLSKLGVWPDWGTYRPAGTKVFW